MHLFFFDEVPKFHTHTVYFFSKVAHLNIEVNGN